MTKKYIIFEKNETDGYENVAFSFLSKERALQRMEELEDLNEHFKIQYLSYRIVEISNKEV